MKIIFLHGFPDNPEVWSHSLKHLASRASCYAPVLHSLPFEKQLAAVEALVDANDEVVLIGHDMGGPIAVEFAARHPAKVKQIILVSTMGLAMFAHRLRLLEQMVKSSYMSVFINPFVNTTTLRPVAKLLLRLVYNLGGLAKDDPLRDNGAEVLDGLARYKELLWKVPKKIFEPDEPILVPTDFVFGKKDPFLMVPSTSELQRFFQQAELHTIEAGHWPMRTHAEEFNELLDKLIFKE